MPIVTEGQKYIDHDSLIPKVIPQTSVTEIIQKEIKLNETKKQEFLTNVDKKEREEEKKKDQNQEKLLITTLKQEVDEELEDFPIILDGGQQKGGEAGGEVSIKTKLDSIKKQMNSYNLN